MVTVAFADIQGFSKIYNENNSHDIVDELDNIFLAFEDISQKYKIERIKTIGDTYMCAGGIPVKNITNPIDVVLSAIEMRHFLHETQQKRLTNNKQIWEVRIGLHTGPVMASTTGKKKISYSIKGDTVNIASRMQAASRTGQINISIMTYELVKEYFECEYFGRMPVKYQGDIEMYIVKGLKPRFSDDNKMVFPNSKFKTKYLLRQLSDIQEIILDRLEKELPKYLFYHNVKHTIDVVSQVELIGIGEGISEDEMLLIKTAGLFHDTGHIIGYDEHECHGTDIARQFLPLYGYSMEQIEKICTLIMATKLPPQPKTLLEKIICDADLDYLGRSDFIPVSNTLYEELKYQNKIGSINDWNKLQVKFISNHYYFTDTANKFREIKKQMQIERIKSLIE
jgi:class 3 adenylate cyclase